jgi:4-amino-4-deoxy-L-arabinose transferase-like glycosyltransferase
MRWSWFRFRKASGASPAARGHTRRFREGEAGEPSRPRSAAPADPLAKFIVEEIELSSEAPAAATTEASRRSALRRPSAGMLDAARLVALWLGLTALLAAAAAFGRSLWPMFGETRVLAIAWEMWTARAFLVPQLNGEPFLAAPLFFWLVHLGWALFGVSEAWARWLPALAAVGVLLVTARLARLLWPGAREVARYAPLVLVGTFAFAFSITLTLPTLWLVLAVQIALWALVLRWRQRDERSFLLLGTGLGLGLLAGGPIVLVYVLPLALAAPLWARGDPRLRWRHWYADLAKALVIASVLLAIWLAAAAKTAGFGYGLAWLGEGLALFQRLEPLSASGPWWWLLAALPLAFLPWSLLPLLWWRVWHIRHAPLDAGFGFCLFWIWFALGALMAFGHTQPQWLLPLLPAGALAVSWLWLHETQREIGADSALAGFSLPLVVLGAAVLVLPKLPRLEALPGVVWEISPFAGLGLIGLGVALAFLPQLEIRRRLRETAAANALFVVLAVLAFGLLWDERLRVNEAADRMAALQAAGRPIAVVGEYHGEFQFPARLAVPPRVLEPAQAENWAAWHPQGVLVAFKSTWQPRFAAPPLFEIPWGEGSLRAWAARAAAGLDQTDDASRPAGR